MCRLSRQRINWEISSGSGLILIGTKEQKKRKRERERWQLLLLLLLPFLSSFLFLIAGDTINKYISDFFNAPRRRDNNDNIRYNRIYKTASEWIVLSNNKRVPLYTRRLQWTIDKYQIVDWSILISRGRIKEESSSFFAIFYLSETRWRKENTK